MFGVRWPLRRRAPRPEPPPPEESETDLTFRSLGLAELVQRLEADRKYSILDLGPAVPENVDFFSRRRCTLVIENLWATLSASVGPERRRTLSKLLRYPEETRFDVVMVWDLLDYLEPEAAQILMPRLQSLCRPGALIFALTSYRSNIPDRPATFKLVDDRTLLYGRLSTNQRPGPRLTSRDLQKRLPGCSIDASYLLRNGRQEFLFVRD